MTQLEYARQLFGYDPETTPQRELECATRWRGEAEFRHESNRKTLAELDDSAVYEWWYDDGADIHRATKREIVTATPVAAPPRSLRAFTSANRTLACGSAAALLDGTAEHTKAVAEEPDVRREPVAVRRTAVPGEVVPAAAPVHPVRARCSTRRIISHSSTRIVSGFTVGMSRRFWLGSGCTLGFRKRFAWTTVRNSRQRFLINGRIRTSSRWTVRRQLVVRFSDN